MEGARFDQGRGASRRPALAAAEGFRRTGSRARPSRAWAGAPNICSPISRPAKSLLMHLGMSGSFRVLHDGGERTPGGYYHERSEHAAHDHVVFHMSSGAPITFNDPRRFGSMKLVPRAELDAGAAVARARARAARQRVRRRHAGARVQRQEDRRSRPRSPDQRVVAGLGNIYVCEALHRALLSPKRAAPPRSRRDPARQPSAPSASVAAITAVLKDAIAAGGSSLRDHRRTDGELGDFQHNFRVYDREGKPCPTPGCGGTIKRIVQTGQIDVLLPGVSEVSLVWRI